MRLSDLPQNLAATVTAVEALGPADPIARRLRDLGFVQGEPIRVVAQGPVRRDPLLVQIGYTRFALRKTEAARVRVNPGPGSA